MSTKALIGRVNEDGTVSAVQATYDGGLDHTGFLLFHHWSDPSLVDQIIEGGDMTILGTRVGTPHNGFSAPPDPAHIEDTIFIARDRRGDRTVVGAQNYGTPEQFWQVEIEGRSWQHRYLFADGEWYHAENADSALLLDHLDALSVIGVIVGREGSRRLRLEAMPDAAIGQFGLHGTIEELTSFFDTLGGWRWAWSRVDDPTVIFDNDAALVAISLRYGITPEEE